MLVLVLPQSTSAERGNTRPEPFQRPSVLSSILRLFALQDWFISRSVHTSNHQHPFILSSKPAKTLIRPHFKFSHNQKKQWLVQVGPQDKIYIYINIYIYTYMYMYIYIYYHFAHKLAQKKTTTSRRAPRWTSR